MITPDTIHKDAVKFLKELKPSLRMALQLNKRFEDISTSKDGHDSIHTAYLTLVRDKLDFSLTEAVVIISNSYFHSNLLVRVLDGESQIDATRRHAAFAYGEAVRHTAANIYAGMWQDWMHGKGDVDEILKDKLGE